MKERIHTSRQKTSCIYHAGKAFVSINTRLSVLVCALSFFTQPTQSQVIAPATKEDSLLHRDYHFVETSNPWLNSHNGAMLTLFQFDNIFTNARYHQCG